jgi:shikimate O-hydroxycinnamoyltransferase
MNAISLSPVDYVFTGVASQPIAFAFSYPNKLDPVVLRNSLNRTLDDFPILSCELNRISENDYEFDIREDGLTFDVVESKSVFQESDRIEQYITPVNSVEGKPLTRITLTQTPNGSILAVSVSHALADGFSYFHFLSSWARLCRGNHIIKPYLERGILSSNLNISSRPITSEDVYADCGLFYCGTRREPQIGHMNHERIFISNETIRSYSDDARKEHNVSLTQSDVINALLWKKYIPLWNRENNDPLTYLTCPFDFRRIKADFPKSYFGCALCFATASIHLNALSNKSIGDLAILIRDSVGKIRNDYVLRSLGTLESLRMRNGLAALEEVHLRSLHHGMTVTNLSRLPIKDLDFGSGAPVGFLAYAEVSNSAAILPSENGVEVLVVHPPKEE